MKQVLASFSTKDGVYEDTIFETERNVKVHDNGDNIVVWTEREDENNAVGYGHPFTIIPKHSLLYLLVCDDDDDTQ